MSDPLADLRPTGGDDQCAADRDGRAGCGRRPDGGGLGSGAGEDYNIL